MVFENLPHKHSGDDPSAFRAQSVGSRPLFQHLGPFDPDCAAGQPWPRERCQSAASMTTITRSRIEAEEHNVRGTERTAISADREDWGQIASERREREI